MPNNKDSGSEKMLITVEEIVLTLRTGVKPGMSSPGHTLQEIRARGDRGNRIPQLRPG